MVSCTALADGATRQPSVLELGQRGGVDRLDLGDDDVRLVLLDRFAQRRAVEHRKDLERIGDLHRRRILVAVAGDQPAAEPLGGDRELPAQLAGAEQHQSGGCMTAAIAGGRAPPLDGNPDSKRGFPMRNAGVALCRLRC